MSRQNPGEFDELDNELRRLFTRAAAQIEPRRDLAASVQRRLAQGSAPHSAALYRLPSIAATLSIVAVVALLIGVLTALGRGGLRPGGGAPAPTQVATVAPTHTTAPAPLTVSSVTLTVTPSSIAGTTCGSQASFTYTATFHLPGNTAGGTIQFAYTLNNGRSQTPGSVSVGLDATSATFTFTSSGVLPPDHTYPGPALVMVTSPNTLTSAAVIPSGSCATPPPTGPFQVTSVTMSVSPNSIAGRACGSVTTVTYRAVFHLAANGPGGTIHYEYTTNNGRGSTLATLTVAPGQTTATATFTWSGALPADHTMPEPGGVIVDSPNSVTSSLVGPSGMCS